MPAAYHLIRLTGQTGDREDQVDQRKPIAFGHESQESDEHQRCAGDGEEHRADLVDQFLLPCCLASARRTRPLEPAFHVFANHVATSLRII